MVNITRILFGWELSPKWPKKTLQLFRKVYTNNGSHMNTSFYGTLFVLLIIVISDQMVYLSMSIYYDDKSENIRNKLLLNKKCM